MDEWFDLTCQVTVGLLPKYLDDDLPEAQVVRLEQHIVICPGCRTRLTQLRRTIAAVSGLRGAGLERRVREGMDAPLGADADDDDVRVPDAGPVDRVVAYKFLAGDRMAPFSQVRWPEPGGGWVWASAPAGACRRAVHACRAGDLAYWLDEKLWRVELAGGVTESASKIVAERGRLLTVVDGWPDVSAAFIEDCAARLADLLNGAADNRDWRAVRTLKTYVQEIEGDTDPASVSYTVAHAAGIAGWLPGEGLAARGRGERTPFDAERRRQSRWLGQRLGLTG
jgi:Putative zinc-finger